MKKRIVLMIILLASLMSCSTYKVPFKKNRLQLINRAIDSLDQSGETLVLNRKKGDGLAILRGIDFDKGALELELKGENNPQKSFVGVAFNIQNDSTYEAVYFRPFNFRSDEKIRREHSVQYIYKPDYEWRFLRTNHEGRYEAEYPRRPSPDDWFRVRIAIDPKKIVVYDLKTQTELLTVDRLAQQVSNSIGLWTGYNSKGAFRNLKIAK